MVAQISKHNLLWNPPQSRAFSPCLRQIFPVSPQIRAFAAKNARVLHFSAFYRIVFQNFTVVCSHRSARLESMKKFFVAANSSFFRFFRNFAFILQNSRIYPHGFPLSARLLRRSLTAHTNSAIFILCNRTYKKIHSSRTTCKSPSFPKENAIEFGKSTFCEAFAYYL